MLLEGNPSGNYTNLEVTPKLCMMQQTYNIGKGFNWGCLSDNIHARKFIQL